MSDDVIWLRPEHSARGPRPTKSRGEITAAAVEIADTDGIEAVSMRRVASAVGLGTMSLYRYVPAKEDLLDLMLDAVSGEYELPDAPSGDWRSDLRMVASQQRGIVHRHPWVPQVLIMRPSYGPNVLRYLEFCLSAMQPTGLESGAMLEVIALVNASVASYVSSEIAGERERRRTGRTAEQQRAAAEPYMRSVIESGKYPLFTRAITEGAAALDADAQFERMVRRLLDGLVAAGD